MVDIRWNQDIWQAQARAWIDQALQQQGVALRGPVELVHNRPWSAVMRVPTEEGDLYFKAALPLLAHEPALTQMLSRLRPDCTLPVLAADYERGWMLTLDGGSPLRAFLHELPDLQRAEGLMPLLAGLQIEMTDHREQLLALLPFDRRVERLPGLFADLLEDRAALMVGQEDGLSEEEYQRLRALLPRYRDMCAQLARCGIPNTLHHDDFHDGNVFSDGQNQRFILSDWGESCLSHPFFSLVICLRSLSDRVGLPEEACDIPEQIHPALARLRDLYLQPWQRFAAREKLADCFNLAWRVGMVNRALTWRAVTASLDPALQPEYRYAVSGWLGEFLSLMERTP